MPRKRKWKYEDPKQWWIETQGETCPCCGSDCWSHSQQTEVFAEGLVDLRMSCSECNADWKMMHEIAEVAFVRPGRCDMQESVRPQDIETA